MDSPRDTTPTAGFALAAPPFASDEADEVAKNEGPKKRANGFEFESDMVSLKMNVTLSSTASHATPSAHLH